jgi:hypothetical protein
VLSVNIHNGLADFMNQLLSNTGFCCQVCVSECPDENYNYRYHYYNRDSQVETLKEWPQTNKIYCRKDKTLKDVLDDEGDYNPVCSLFLLLVLCHTCFVII